MTGFHASLADPKRGNIPGFPEKPVSRSDTRRNQKYIFSLTQLCQHEFGIAHIFFQGTVDRHFDLHHLHRKRSTPGHQRTAVHLLLPASQACQTHKVRFATAPDGLLYIHIREEKHSRYFDFVSGGCLMRQKRSPGRG